MRTRGCLVTTILGATSPEGFFKTPPLRNVGKNQLEITKAYMHNGYFKSLADIVHYYNTRFDGTGAPTDFDPANNSKTVCDDPQHRGRNGRGSDRQ